MVLVAVAVLSTMTTSAYLSAFSENFTIGINACQQELENIRDQYVTTTDLSFSELLTYSATFDPDQEPGIDNFIGQISAVDPFANRTGAGNIVVLTARVGFRARNRIVGANIAFTTVNDNTPCQVSMTFTQRR